MRALVLGAALLVGLTGCAAGGDAAAPSPSPSSRTAGSPAGSSSPTRPAGLVGEWERITTCQQRVHALKSAGLGRFAAEHAAGEGWLPGITTPDQVEDPHHPCTGAVPLTHSHFFTADGLFGSRDANGDQVDDGTYRIPEDGTVVISKEFGEVTFHYRVLEDGSTLFLDPVMPDCTNAGCFAAQWAVAVAYPGLPWSRSG